MKAQHINEAHNLLRSLAEVKRYIPLFHPAIETTPEDDTPDADREYRSTFREVAACSFHFNGESSKELHTIASNLNVKKSRFDDAIRMGMLNVLYERLTEIIDRLKELGVEVDE